MQSLAKQSQPANPSLNATSDRLVSDCLTALARWNPSETLPAGLSSTSLLAAIEAQRNKLLPATGREITDVTAALLTHASAANIKVDNPAALKATWATHCQDMPADLLISGLRGVLKHWSNTYCLPQPGAIWEHIEPELIRMRRDMAILESARKATSEALDDPADRMPSAETDAVIAKTLAVLRTASGNRRRVA